MTPRPAPVPTGDEPLSCLLGEASGLPSSSVPSGAELPDEVDAGGAELVEGGVRGPLRDPGGEVQQDARREPGGHGVQRGAPHAVVGPDPDDVDGVNVAGPQPVGQALAVEGALESGVGRGVLTLVEDRL